MSSLITAALIGWVPLCCLFFTVLRPHRAVIACYLGGWALLPPLALSLPGLPDYSRVSASTIGALIGVLIFGWPQLSQFRFRWFDLPALVMAVCPFISSMTNGLGAYDGLSASFSATLIWTLPYFISRVFLKTIHEIRDLAIGMTIVGLIYAPLILFEVATRQPISNLVYGTGLGMTTKYGLPDPIVFMPQRLVLAIFISTLTVAAGGLYMTRAVHSVLGIPIQVCLAILIAATIVSHQTAGVAFMVLGLSLMRVLVLGSPGPFISAGAVLSVPLVLMKAGLRVSALYIMTLLGAEYFRRMNPNRLVWIMVLLTPLYTSVRATGLWDGELGVSLAYQFLGQDRATSIGYRFMCENYLVEKALQQPVFGWGGWGRSRIDGLRNGVEIVTDGLWIIVLGERGLVGLSAMIGMMSIPLIQFLRKNPISTWRDPNLTPAVGLGIALQLYSFDNLLNVSISPVPILIAGGLIALQSTRPRIQRQETDLEFAWADQLVSSGHIELAEATYRQLAESSVSTSAADAWSRISDLKRIQGQCDEAFEAARQAAAFRSELIRGNPNEPSYRHAMADDTERMARCLTQTGQTDTAIELWEDVISMREQMAQLNGMDSQSRECWARSLNDLAWFLAKNSSSNKRFFERSISLAEQAVHLCSEEPAYWNTLGLAYYRGEKLADALSALQQSTVLGGDDYREANNLIMAMVLARQGSLEDASQLLNEAEAWLFQEPGRFDSLQALRGEATLLLQRPVSPVPPPVS